MKKYFIFILATVIGLLNFSSCQNETETDLSKSTNKSVKFTTSIYTQSRTTSTENLSSTFTNGDEIGIFVYNNDNEIVARNLKYTYNNGEWTSSSPFNVQEGIKFNYYAYYPYKQDASNPEAINTAINLDQSSDLYNNDYLTAQNTESKPGAENITLNFSHLMSFITVKINDGVIDDSNATVMLESIRPNVTINAIKGVVNEAYGDMSSIKMYKTDGKLEYKAIVPAQSLSIGNQILTVEAGNKSYDVFYTPIEIQNLNYIKGGHKVITVTALSPLPEGSDISIEESPIKDWVAGTISGNQEIELMPVTELDLSGLPFLDLTNITKVKGWSNEKFTGTNDAWFIREQNSNIAEYSINENAIAIKLNPGTRAYWQNISIGFHSACKFELAKYRLTFSAKSEENSGTIYVGITSSGEKKIFYNSNLDAITQSGNASKELQTYSFDFDFTQASTVYASPDKTNTTEDDVNGINIIFNNGTNNSKVESTIYISDIKLTKISE